MDNRYSRYAERDLDSRERIEYGLTDKSYKERWAGKGKDWQNSVVGKKRADLVRSGLIDFNDIVDKRTSKLYTLKQLENKYKIPIN